MDGKQDVSFPLDSILMENWLEKKKKKKLIEDDWIASNWNSILMFIAFQIEAIFIQ